MKDLKDFGRFYEKWCAKNKKPFMGVDKVNKYWQQAWDEFMKTELVDEYESRKEEYNNMKLLSFNELKNRENIIEEKESTSLWDEVKSQLK